MALGKYDIAMGIGGEAGQGIATPGDIFARIVVRRGLHLSTYNAYQSIIRGGHIFLTLRICDREVFSHGDKLDLLLCLNQDTMDRHQRHIGHGGRVLFNSDSVTPGESSGGDLCGLPVGELTQSRNRLIQNTVMMGAVVSLMGIEFQVLQDSLELRFFFCPPGPTGRRPERPGGPRRVRLRGQQLPALRSAYARWRQASGGLVRQ